MSLIDLADTLAEPPTFFHVGMVVDDLDAACESYASQFGVRWTDHTRSWSLPVTVDGEPRTVELRVAYSVAGPPFFEFIQELSGDTWAASSLNLNHVGFWVRDLKQAASALHDSGMPLVVRDAAKADFTYHRTANGMWIELCDAVSNMTVLDTLIGEAMAT
jgi:catechol 2,3-dioxygenase-like lactoylglutathione lyase family enzyme